MAKIRITQTRSKIGSTQRQKKTIDALGLKRIRHTVEHEDNQVIRGMIKKVEHLVTIEEIN
ncbi:MAG: 50S ribosomal protein L30 [Salinivirgaceae bacterium]|jgi:large subunit ribosomal protein L30|nr:MAG: 50S ribosomal protein L30 [Salinivirgaceae bacterium]